MSQLSLHNVAFSYNAHWVVVDTSFEINKGEYVGIVGPSGSGKSTLLKLLLGLLKPSSGEVHVHIEHSVGYVAQLQTIDWYFPITADQVIALGLRSHGITYPWLSSKEKSRVRLIMKQLLIEDAHGRHIKDLSGGQQQRVFLGRALIDNPDILILDEPTASIDIKTRDVILHLLEKLKKVGLTIVITTHDINSVASHLPRVICFNKTVIADGSPNKIFKKVILNRTFQSDLLVLRNQGTLLVTDKPHQN